MGNTSQRAERWRPVVGYEGFYAVSDHGRVMRSDGCRRSRAKYLKPQADRYGYLTVNLSMEGQRNRVSIHVLVARAFIGPKPEGKQCAHRDGNKLNCRKSNLRWATQRENDQDKIKHCSMPRGEDHCHAVLTTKDVKNIWAIRKRCAFGRRRIAKILGLSPSATDDVLRKRTWRHLCPAK